MENLQIDTPFVIGHPEKIGSVVICAYEPAGISVLLHYLRSLFVVLLKVIPEETGPKPDIEKIELRQDLIQCLLQQLTVDLFLKLGRHSVCICHRFSGYDRKKMRRVIQLVPAHASIFSCHFIFLSFGSLLLLLTVTSHTFIGLSLQYINNILFVESMTGSQEIAVLSVPKLSLEIIPIAPSEPGLYAYERRMFSGRRPDTELRNIKPES